MSELTQKDVDRMLGDHKTAEVKKTGKGAHQAALSLLIISQKISSPEYEPTMIDIKPILEAFYNWFGHNLDKSIRMARSKSGYALFETDVSVSEKDLETIKNAWITIKDKCRNLLCDELFETDIYDKSYGVYRREKPSIVDCMDKVVETPQEDDKKRTDAFCKLYRRVYASFYGKTLNPQDEHTMGDD
jgi:hypothetical protein